jgi:hypothetical protein
MQNEDWKMELVPLIMKFFIEIAKSVDTNLPYQMTM